RCSNNSKLLASSWWSPAPDALAQLGRLLGMVQRLANLQRLDPVGVRAIALAFFQVQIAHPLERARQADLVVVAPGDGQRAVVVFARPVELAQRARGGAQVQQRDALPARVLQALLE